MIPVRNIYYMLAYAFQVLREKGFSNLETEEFGDQVAELCAAILIQGVTVQLKRGLERDYVERVESTATLRGRICLTESIRTGNWQRMRPICAYEEFHEDTPMNRILRSTMELLLHAGISVERKRRIRALLLYFGNVTPVDLMRVNWHMRYRRHHQTYRMLMFVCYLVVKGLIQKQADGSARFLDFLDEQRMCTLYEKFILAYYRREHPELSPRSEMIRWVLDEDTSGSRALLPVMRCDVMLSRGNHILIIDAKYYSNVFHRYGDSEKIHTPNLNQIFAYVKNKCAELGESPHRVSGLLLYAATDESILPDETYSLSGNIIGVQTLDLSQPFSAISTQLESLIDRYLG